MREERRGEDELPHAIGMGGRIGGGDHPAVGEAEQVDLLLAERGAQLLEVGDVVVERVRVGGAALLRAARVEEQQRARRPEPGEVAELRAGEPGPAGVAEQQRPVSAPVVLRSPCGELYGDSARSPGRGS